MPLDFPHRLIGEILVDLEHDTRLHVRVERVAQVGERARRGQSSVAPRRALPNENPSSRRDLPRGAKALSTTRTNREGSRGQASCDRARARCGYIRSMALRVASDHAWGGRDGTRRRADASLRLPTEKLLGTDVGQHERRSSPPDVRRPPSRVPGLG